MTMQFNSNELQEVLPHRYPMQLVDRITDGEPGKWAKGIKCVTVNEPFFCGHLPQEHVMPGALMVEALAQVGAVIALTVPENKGKIVYFGGIKEAKFRQKVHPGDVLEMEVHLTKSRGNVGFGEGTAMVDGKVACKCTMTFVID